MRWPQFFTPILLLLSVSAWSQAYKNSFAFKGAVGIGATHLQSLGNETETTPSAGFNLHFGHRWERWEINLSSYVNLALTSDHNFEIHQSQVRARGQFRSVGFGPTLRSYFPHWSKKEWAPYFALGPLVALQTFKLEKGEVTDGQYSLVNKLTYESAGLVLAFGLEEWIPRKKRPSFVELSYKGMRSFRRTEVGGTKKEVSSIVKEGDNKSIHEHVFTLSLGILIF